MAFVTDHSNTLIGIKQEVISLLQQQGGACPQSQGPGLTAALAQLVTDALFTSDFGPRPLEWLATLVSNVEQQQQPPQLAPDVRLLRCPTFGDRVFGVVRRVQPNVVLQRLGLLAAGVTEQRRRIAERVSSAQYFEWKNVLLDVFTYSQYSLEDQLNIQAQVLQCEQDICQLFAQYVQLAADACALLRFGTQLVLFRVSEWRTRQRRLANRAETRDRRQAKGQHSKTSPELLRELDALGAHVEGVGDVLQALLDELRQMQQEAAALPVAERQTLDRLHEPLHAAVAELATHTLVMYNQPLQVLKKLNHFSASVLWLAGPVLQRLGVNVKELRLHARLVPGREAEGEPCAPQLQPLDPNDKTVAFLVHVEPVVFAWASNARGGGAQAGGGGGRRKACVAKFLRLKWNREEHCKKRARRASTAYAESGGAPEEKVEPDDSVAPIARQSSVGVGEERVGVTDRLHFLLVESEPLAIPDGTQVVLQDVSFPIVLIVNNTQESQAMFTVLWRNAFASADEVPWSALRPELSALFESRTTTCRRADGVGRRHSSVVAGRGVPDAQLEYLRERFLSSNHLTNGSGLVRLYDLKSRKFTEQLRESEPNASKQFTFVEYLHSAVRLVSRDEVTRRLWVEQVVWGFISKEDAKQCLLRHAATQSAMLVRFSEKQPGAVSVVRYVPKGGEQQRAFALVDVVEPWDTKALEKEALIVRLWTKAKSLKLIVSLPLSDTAAATRNAQSLTFQCGARDAAAGAAAAAAACAQSKLLERDSLETLKRLNNNQVPHSSQRSAPEGYVCDIDSYAYFYEQYIEQCGGNCRHAGWNLTALMRSRRWEQGTDITDECTCRTLDDFGNNAPLN